MYCSWEKGERGKEHSESLGGFLFRGRHKKLGAGLESLVQGRARIAESLMGRWLEDRELFRARSWEASSSGYIRRLSMVVNMLRISMNIA